METGPPRADTDQVTEEERPAPAELPWAVVVPPTAAPPALGPVGSDTAATSSRRPSRALVVVSVLAVVMSAVAAVAVSRATRARLSAAAATQIQRGTAMGTAGASYTFTWVNRDGSPVRWNPCAPIEWVSSSGRAPAHALDDFRAALDRVEELTGLRFEYRGEVDEAPSGNRAASQPRYGDGWAPMLVAWAPVVGTELGTRLGTGADTVGVATPVAISRPSSPGVIVTAQIVFESGRTLPSGFTSSGARGAVMLHELAHAVGLAHVDDPSQLMFDGDHAGFGAGELGHGDMAGLEHLGASGGCLEVPDPDEVA